MTKLIKNYKLAFHYLFKDSTNFLLAMIPIGLGISLYAVAGNWVFGSGLESGQQWLESHIASQNWGSVVYYLAVTLLTIFFFLLVNWTFVLVVSLIAAPFNDILSRRIDQMHQGKECERLNVLLAQMGGNIPKILWNEIKKIVLLIILIIFAFLLSLIPILVPISFILSAIILSAGYLDYSWSRYDLPAKKCFASLKRGWISYSIVGFGYLFILSVPLLNLFSISLAVAHYTILFIDDADKLLEGSAT